MNQRFVAPASRNPQTAPASADPSPTRGSLRRMLGALSGRLTNRSAGSPSNPKRGRLLLETLEGRQMLAGDVELLFTEAAVPTPTSAPTATASQAGVQAAAQGEPGPDLVAFANALDAAGVVFYGAHWCPACTEQTQLFEDGGKDLPFVEVTDANRELNQTGIDEGISQFPTWEFPDGTRAVGVQSLQTLSQRSGVAIPQSETPTFAEIGTQTVGQGSPLHIPIDAYDPDGGPLTVTLSVADPALLEATVITGNRSLRLDLEGFGDMVFELFEGRAETAAGRVIELAESDFYDGIIFHRVVDNFVLQAGDPTGTGTSGSNLGNFDDDFHPDLQHNTSGILSFAKTTDDTNNSQFFITETPTRHLDFNHSIFGILTEGEDVREAISGQAVNSASRPLNDVTIADATVFTDSENSVIMLRGLASSGSTTVTVTVTDQDGNTHSEVVTVNLAADTSNSQPFLNAIETPTATPAGTPATLQLSATDVEGDAVQFIQSLATTDVGATSTVNPTTGLVTVTPAAGFVGNVDVIVGVQAPGGGNDFDSQRVRFAFAESTVAAPSAIDLNAGSDSGTSNSDNVTNRETTVFTVRGVTSGNTVEIVEINSGSVVGTAVATGSTVEITTTNVAALGDGTYALAARQRSGSINSELSTTLAVTIDSTRPDSVIGSAGRQANVGTAFETDLASPEEGNGLVYSLVNPPSGVTINAATGLIRWTPTEAQRGENNLMVTTTDVAGNTRTETLPINVADTPLGGIVLVARDLQGNVLTSLNTGQEFNLEFRATDLRNAFAAAGIFSAFADVTFNSDVVRPVPGSAIEYSRDFSSLPSGTFNDGEIDELGAVIGNTSPTQNADELIATVRFEALQSGQANFNTNPAEAAGSEFNLFLLSDENGGDRPLTADRISFGSLSLDVSEGFTVVDDTATVAEDSQNVVIDVLANDTVVESDTTLTIASVTQPDNGTVAIVSGQLQFTPASNFTGTTSFTYRAAASSGGQSEATVNVTVTDVNDPPTAVADTFIVVQDTSDNSLAVLGNDSIAPDTGETLAVTAVGTTSNGGTVEIADSGGGVVYTPADGFVGTETFTYTISDGTLTATETVTVTVETTNNPPTAVADSLSVTEDASQASFDVLANDTRDTDGEAFTLVAVGTPSAGGAAAVNADGTQLLYTPAANFAGVETVTYTIRDSGGGQSTATATFTVAGVNDPPPASNQEVLVIRSEGNRSVLAISDLPANVDSGETLTFTNVTASTQGGTATINAAANEILYTPPQNDFIGEDVLTYTVTDSSGSTATGTLTLNVQEFTRRSITIRTQSTSADGLYQGGAVRLVGTNDAGESVDLPVTVTDGTPGFTNLLPGDYSIEFPAVPFLQGGETARSIAIRSDVDDGDLAVDAPMGRLHPSYVNIRDWLGSTRKSNILAAVAPGESPVLMVASTAVESVSSPQVAFNQAGTEITITGKNDSDADVTATIPVNQDRRAEPRGSADALQLFRISVDPSDVSFSVVGASSASSASAAALSAAVVSASDSAISNSAISVSGSQASSGPVAVAAASRSDVFVPGLRTDVAEAISAQDSSTGPDAADSAPVQSPVSTLKVIGSGDDASVDAAMPQVAETLRIESETTDQLAARQSLGESLDVTAIDSLLRDDSMLP